MGVLPVRTEADRAAKRCRNSGAPDYILDRAIRLLNEGTQCESVAQYHREHECLKEAAELLAPIANLLQIDPEAKL